MPLDIPLDTGADKAPCLRLFASTGTVPKFVGTTNGTVPLGLLFDYFPPLLFRVPLAPSVPFRA